jgi:hypothetical protein
VAEWLRRGLQILAPRFDSGRGLQNYNNIKQLPKAFDAWRLQSSLVCLAKRRNRAGPGSAISNIPANLRFAIVQIGVRRQPPKAGCTSRKLLSHWRFRRGLICSKLSRSAKMCPEQGEAVAFSVICLSRICTGAHLEAAVHSIKHRF